MAKKMAKLKGSIKTIKREEGFGFITHTDTGIDHFFHRTALERTAAKPWDELVVGTLVQFTQIEGPKGLRAIEVEVVD